LAPAGSWQLASGTIVIGNAERLNCQILFGSRTELASKELHRALKGRQLILHLVLLSPNLSFNFVDNAIPPRSANPVGRFNHGYSQGMS